MEYSIVWSRRRMKGLSPWANLGEEGGVSFSALSFLIGSELFLPLFKL
jgi:hypothetical protein